VILGDVLTPSCRPAEAEREAAKFIHVSFSTGRASFLANVLDSCLMCEHGHLEFCNDHTMAEVSHTKSN
jgi:hypothetical protein